jgi:hypothetical protein
VILAVSQIWSKRKREMKKNNSKIEETVRGKTTIKKGLPFPLPNKNNEQ